MRRRQQAILYEFLENKSPGGLGAPGLRGSVHERDNPQHQIATTWPEKKEARMHDRASLTRYAAHVRGGVPSVNHPHNSVNPGLVPGQRNRRPGSLPAP